MIKKVISGRGLDWIPVLAFGNILQKSSNDK